MVFLAGLADCLDELVLVGRLDPKPATWHYRIRAGVRFAALPYYPDLSRYVPASIALDRSVRRFWSLLASVDAVWLLGPHPLALVFAVMGVLRRKRVVLGVRQDLPQYVCSRHPGRRSLFVLAQALELIFRSMTRRLPVVVVGAQLARHYSAARSRHTMVVSLVREQTWRFSPSLPDRSYEGDLRVLSVGRLDEEKNPLLMAEVLARLLGRERRWRLVVCGDGPLREPLRQRLEELGVGARAELRGYVPIDDGLIDLYRSSHALLHVSRTEGFPQVLLEAFAARLPVVGTTVGGVRDLADGCALLVPPDDAGAAAGALERIAGDSALRERLVTAALRVAQSHTLEAERERVVGFLDGRPDGAAER